MFREINFKEFLISNDKSKLDLKVIHNFLARSYWAENIPFQIVEKSVNNSYCYGIYLDSEQIGFARIITDYSTFGYLADVFVLENFRGRGISKALMKFIMSDPELLDLRNFLLATKDAHTLYEKFGFKIDDKPENIMAIKRPGIYKKDK